MTENTKTNTPPTPVSPADSPKPTSQAKSSAPTSQAGPSKPVVRADKAQQIILIVDNDKELQYKIKDYLEDNNIQEKNSLNFIFAESVSEALKIIQDEKIDLIVLEIVLPIINGFYLLNVMEGTKEIPFIIYTKLGNSEDLKKIIEKGNIINIFIKQLTPVDEFVMKIIAKEDKKSDMDKIIADIGGEIKLLDENKTEKSLAVLECPKCHIILAKKSHFCNNCGQKIIND